jgi:hypothetical protein
MPRALKELKLTMKLRMKRGLLRVSVIRRPIDVERLDPERFYDARIDPVPPDDNISKRGSSNDSQLR